jgi:hypothetical protein
MHPTIANAMKKGNASSWGDILAFAIKSQTL